MKNYKSMAAASVMLLLLAACGSSGIGDILGGGSNNDARTYEIRGIVDSVDVNGRTLFLTNVTGYQSMLSNGSGSGSSVRVYFDDQTEVDYQGQGYQVQDLEQGDEVRIRVDESDNRLMANLVTVERDASPGTSSGSNSNYPTYGSTLRGTVRYVDTNRGTIEIDRGNGTSIAEFNLNTPVYWNNQTYRVTDLERGDEVEIRYRDLGSNRLQATDVTVLRSISSGSSGGGISGSSNTSTIRGTVRSVNTSARTIQLESTSWLNNNFNSGSGTSGGVITISYDTNTSVDVSGRLHPVSGLERGDVVEVTVRSLGGSSYFAERMFLVRDVNSR